MGIFSSVGPRPRVARRSPDSGGGRTLAVRNLCSAPPGTSRRCPLDGTSGFVQPVCSGRGRPPLPPARGLRAWSAWKVWMGRLRLPRPHSVRTEGDRMAERGRPRRRHALAPGPPRLISRSANEQWESGPQLGHLPQRFTSHSPARQPPWMRTTASPPSPRRPRGVRGRRPPPHSQTS